VLETTKHVVLTHYDITIITDEHISSKTYYESELYRRRCFISPDAVTDWRLYLHNMHTFCRRKVKNIIL